MKYAILILLFLFPAAGIVLSQTPEELLAEGKKQEQRYKDEEALTVYQQALRIAPGNQSIVLKCADVSMVMALRQTDPIKQLEGLQQAMKYGEAAYLLDTTNADTNGAMALLCSEMAKRTKSKQEVAQLMRRMKQHADLAVINGPGNAKALHVAGRWHLDVLQLSALKKAAADLIYGGDTKEATIKDAIQFMEQSRTLDKYYTLNHYDLAQAYTLDKQYEKAVELLQYLEKLPARRQFDKDVKAMGAAALQRLQ